MLSLRVKSGEYITIGNDIIVQIFREGTDARVEVKAPRELTILRGEVLERTEQKPDGLFAKRPKSSAHLARDAKNKEKLTARKAYFAFKYINIMLLACKVAAEKSANSLMGVPLRRRSCFPLEAFRFSSCL